MTRAHGGHGGRKGRSSKLASLDMSVGDCSNRVITRRSRIAYIKRTRVKILWALSLARVVR